MLLDKSLTFIIPPHYSLNLLKISVHYILEVIINRSGYFLKNWFFDYIYKHICVFTGLNNSLSPLFYLISWLTVFALETKSAAQGTLRNGVLFVFLLHENSMKTIKCLLAIKIDFFSEIQKKRAFIIYFINLFMLVVLLIAPMFLNLHAERTLSKKQNVFYTDESKIRKLKLLKFGALVYIDWICPSFILIWVYGFISSYRALS